MLLYAEILSSAGQILACLAAITGLLFWRSSSCTSAVQAFGQIQRASRTYSLSRRIRRLRIIFASRIVLFAAFGVGLVSCMLLLRNFRVVTSMYLNGRVPEPGIMGIATSAAGAATDLALIMTLLCYIVLLVEWVLDSVCHYWDLDESLQAIGRNNRVERAESCYLLLEKYKDVLALWQARLRYLADHSDVEAGTIQAVLKGIGSREVTWEDFSRAVVMFRSTQGYLKPNQEAPAALDSGVIGVR